MAATLRNKLSTLVRRRLQVERRAGKRVAPMQPTLALLQANGDGQPTTARVQNLSFNGMAVLAERDYAIGTILRILLINAGHTFSAAVELKVVRAVRYGGNQYLLAGPFAHPLPHEEVVPFIV